jgi:fucose 4-O-acetylase-like acetyltransferase
MIKILKRWYHPELAPGEIAHKKRDYYLDNLKFILIVLVVISHFALKLAYVNEIKYLQIFIYIFHMPCFIFVNGFLSKRLNVGGKLRVDKILMVFWMYLFFKLGNVVLGSLFHQEVDLSLFKDASAPWYLLALCFWYVSVPVLERIKPKFLVTGSLLVGLLAGYISSINDTFSLSRVFVFFPYFIFGFCLTQEKLEVFLNKRLRLPAVILLITVLGCLPLLWKYLGPVSDIIYASSPYTKSLGDLSFYGLFIRGLWYLLAIALSAAVMLLVPRCNLFFSPLGERTLQIYMTHVWIRNALTYAGFFTIIKSGPRYLTLVVLLGSVALTFLLANRWLKKLYDLMMSPKLFQGFLK